MTICSECGFDNPRRWVACARCGRLLGPRLSARDRYTDAAWDAHTTRRAAAPLPEVFDAPDEVTLHTATRSDARPLLGQERALSTVRANLATAFEQGRATLTFVEGAAGSGRTRLLERASELAAKNYAHARVRYAAVRNAEEGPYAPFSRLLLERFDITPASSPSLVREDMLRTVQRALPDSDAEHCAELTQLLGHIAGVPFPDGPSLKRLEVSPLELRERAPLALSRLLASDCSHCCLLVLLDDMHRAEADAWHVLETLLATRAPIAFVVSGDDSCSSWVQRLTAHAHCAVAPLRPLGDQELGELVRTLLPRLRELPETFIAALRHRSRGNPSAVIELVRALEDRGLFQDVLDPGELAEPALQVDLDRLEHGELPLSMSDAIRARLTALEPTELAVIQYASIVGELFWDGALLALLRSEESPMPEPDEPLGLFRDATDEARLQQSLAALEARRFIARIATADVPGLSEYTFQFAGARAIVYAEQPEAVRVRRHAVVARWMTLANGLPAEGLPAALARHLQRAGLPARAAEAYLRAADEESARLRTSMALRHAEHALPLIAADELPLRVRALHKQGSLLTTLGRYDEAHAVFGAIVQLAFQIGARGTGAAALNRIARIHRQRGEHARALAYLQEALALFRAAHDQRGVASTLDDLAQVLRLLGDLPRALSAANEALSIRSAGQDARGRAVSLNTLGFIELDRGNFEAAEHHLSGALAIRESIADHEGAVQTRIGLGKLELQRGRMQEALRTFGSALDSAREIGSRRFQCHLMNHLAETHLASGEHERAEQLLFEARELALGMRDQRALSEIQRNLGLVALSRSDPQASQQLSAALALAREYGTREGLALAHRGLARLHARTLFDQGAGSPADAESSFRESIRIFEECGSAHELARTQAELGFHLAERGATPRAREALERAFETMKRLRLPELARVSETLEQL